MKSQSYHTVRAAPNWHRQAWSWRRFRGDRAASAPAGSDLEVGASGLEQRTDSGEPASSSGRAIGIVIATAEATVASQQVRSFCLVSVLYQVLSILTCLPRFWKSGYAGFPVTAFWQLPRFKVARFLVVTTRLATESCSC